VGTDQGLAIAELEKNQDKYYFPSFELINNLSQEGRYFTSNLRDQIKLQLET
jgi:hypothetical protein